MESTSENTRPLVEAMFNAAAVKCLQGKYACDARKELRREYPFVPTDVIRAAINKVRSEYDFPTRREIGLY